jgi:hypothetical protein
MAKGKRLGFYSKVPFGVTLVDLRNKIGKFTNEELVDLGKFFCISWFKALDFGDLTWYDRYELLLAVVNKELVRRGLPDVVFDWSSVPNLP